MIGQHAVTPGQLADAAGRVREVADLDRLAASLAGSSHLVASVAGRVRVQGTVTGVRRVFSARVGGAAVAADRADVLAGLLDAELDEQRLALHLLEPHILYPLAGQPIWRGVDVLPTDHYLVLDGNGRHRLVRSWTPPEPVVPMAEGAPALREALSSAVALRTRGHELVSCDLGGLDSTSVCSLAARGERQGGRPTPPPALIPWPTTSTGPCGRWPGWATSSTTSSRPRRCPFPTPVCSDVDDQLDEPFSAAVERERLLTVARRAAARGSRLHLVGFGGDELLYGSLAHLHSLLRSSPRIALGHLRGFAAKYRWPRGRMLRQLSDTSPYSAWLARVPETLTAPPPPAQEPLLDWGFAPRLPPWTTPAAVQAVRDLIRAEARHRRAPGQRPRPAPGAGGRCGSCPGSPASSSRWRPVSGSRWPPPTTTTG